MKKLLFAIAMVAGFGLSSFAAPAQSELQVVSEVTQIAEFAKIEIADLPKAVTDAIAKKFENSTIIEAAYNASTKVYKVTVKTAEEKEVVVLFDENGEEVK